MHANRCGAHAHGAADNTAWAPHLVGFSAGPRRRALACGTPTAHLGAATPPPSHPRPRPCPRVRLCRRQPAARHHHQRTRCTSRRSAARAHPGITRLLHLHALDRPIRKQKQCRAALMRVLWLPASAARRRSPAAPAVSNACSSPAGAAPSYASGMQRSMMPVVMHDTAAPGRAAKHVRNPRRPSAPESAAGDIISAASLPKSATSARNSMAWGAPTRIKAAAVTTRVSSSLHIHVNAGPSATAQGPCHSHTSTAGLRACACAAVHPASCSTPPAPLSGACCGGEGRSSGRHAMAVTQPWHCAHRARGRREWDT